MSQCSVCNNDIGKTHAAREMLFGTREPFTYFECANCGCLQLETVPADMSAYYRNGYFSFEPAMPSRVRLRVLARRLLARWELARVPGLRFARRLLRGPYPQLESLAKLRINRRMHILDVGCGNGSLLYHLRELGFKAEGVDPYLPEEVIDEYGVRVRRVHLCEVSAKWDVIMFHHSLEHMPHHREVLRLTRERLTETGRCLVRIPMAHQAWRDYGVNWFGLDAPRHLIVHTAKSFHLLAQQSGFSVDSYYCDSEAFHLWASELYKRDIPYSAGGPHLFTADELRRFAVLAKQRNQQLLGDQAVFVLRPL